MQGERGDERLRPLAGQDHLFPSSRGLGVCVIRRCIRGYVIPPYYDSLVGIDRSRQDPDRGADAAAPSARRFVVDGVETTLPLFRALVRDAEFRTASTISIG